MDNIFLESASILTGISAAAQPNPNRRIRNSRGTPVCRCADLRPPASAEFADPTSPPSARANSIVAPVLLFSNIPRLMSSSRRQYPFHLIEPKWQRLWDAQEMF